MNTKEKKSISKEVVAKYIYEYFAKKFPVVEEEMQPRFWEAVIALCVDPEADVSSWLNENNPCFFSVRSNLSHYSKFVPDAQSVYDAAKKLAANFSNAIIAAEEKEFSNFNIFLMQDEIGRLRFEFENLKFLLKSYRLI